MKSLLRIYTAMRSIGSVKRDVKEQSYQFSDPLENKSFWIDAYCRDNERKTECHIEVVSRISGRDRQTDASWL